MIFSNFSLGSFQAKGDPALEGWEVTVELDQPVTQCVDFNAQMTKISDSIYKFGPKPWNRVVPEGTELQLKLHITWERYRISCTNEEVNFRNVLLLRSGFLLVEVELIYKCHLSCKQKLLGTKEYE